MLFIGNSLTYANDLPALVGVFARAGGRPALLMVWPPISRIEAFDDVRNSYAAAARAVDGLFIPAGETWREAWERDPELSFYAADGFHPSPLGSLAAALTTYAVLFEADPSGLTCPMPEGVEVSAEVLEILCESVRESLAARAVHRALMMDAGEVR